MSELFEISLDAVRKTFDRAATRYDEYAVAQQEIGRRLIERLDYLRIEPKVVLDLGCGTGREMAILRDRYKSADVIGMDASEGMLAQAKKRKKWWRRPSLACADANALPLAENSVDLVFSNLLLPWCPHADPVWSEVSRVLRPEGALLFSGLGPDTLKELRAAMRLIGGSFDHVHTFIDMHDIGDALVRNGIANPVMDVELLRLAYKGLPDLLRDLRNSGSQNVFSGRQRGANKGLSRSRLSDNYAQDEGRLIATVEVVYGHGWAGQAPSYGSADGEAYVSIDSLKYPGNRHKRFK
ncbi:MAG: methyltransferase domain-containing protein [Pseudomonadota bacterium]